MYKKSIFFKYAALLHTSKNIYKASFFLNKLFFQQFISKRKRKNT